MFKKHLTNERGMSLLMVLLLMTVLTVLGMSVMSIVINNTKTTSSERDNQSAYYIAEAGITKQMKAAEDAARKLYPLQTTAPGFYTNLESQIVKTTTLTDFASSFGEKPSAKVTIAKVSGENPRQYKITSVGTIGKRSKQLEKTFTISWEMKGGLPLNKDLAVYTDTTISLSGGAHIKGNMGTNSKAASTIRFDGGAGIDGNIYVPKGSENIAIYKPDYMKVPQPQPFKEQAQFQLPPFPSYPSYPLHPNVTVGNEYNKYNVINNGVLQVDNYLAADYELKLNSNTAFKEIKMGSNYTLYINVGSTDKAIVVDHLNVQNGHIILKGTGKLTIYVKNEISMGSGSTVNNDGDIKRLNIYLAKSTASSNVKLGGNQKIFGSLYAENADIEMNGSGGFQGHIFTGGKNVTITGGARAYSTLIYAPNSTFQVLGGGTVKGMIVSRSFEGAGGADVIYESINLNEVPFAPGGSTEIPVGLITSDPVREK